VGELQQENVRLARRWFEEVWNQRRAETVHELLLPDSVGHTEHGDLVGPGPFLEVRAALLGALPDLRVTVEDTVAEGDNVVVRWSAVGTPAGAAGGPVRFRGMTWIRVRGGKFVEGWDAWNAGALMQQLAGPAGQGGGAPAGG
jgi:predicted ester cyclase